MRIPVFGSAHGRNQSRAEGETERALDSRYPRVGSVALARDDRRERASYPAEVRGFHTRSKLRVIPQAKSGLEWVTHFPPVSHSSQNTPLSGAPVIFRPGPAWLWFGAACWRCLRKSFQSWSRG